MAGSTDKLEQVSDDCVWLTAGFLNHETAVSLSAQLFRPCARRARLITEINKIVEESRSKFEIPFRSIEKKLGKGLKFDQFDEIAGNIIKDKINWGRILMIFALLKMVTDGKENEAKYCRFMKERLSHWVSKHGGWEEILKFEKKTTADLLFAIARASARWLVVAGILYGAWNFFRK